MSMRYKGASLSTITPTANNTSAVGIWSMRSQMQAIATYAIVSIYITKYVTTGTFSAPASMGASTTAATMNAITCKKSNGLFVAVGISSGYYGVYATSTDGSTWTIPAAMPVTTNNNYVNGVTCRQSDGLFVAVGLLPLVGSLYTTSTNGSTWTTPQGIAENIGAADVGTGTEMLSVACRESDGLFVAVGSGGKFAASTNGSTWTTPARMNNNSMSNIYMTGVTCRQSDGLFVAVGYQIVTYYPGLYYTLYSTSTNGTTWTQPALMNGSTTNGAMYGVAVNSSGLFVAVGCRYNTTSDSLYSTSTNGSTWTTPVNMNGSSAPAQFFTITVNSSDFFIAAGYDCYATSTDGSTWTTPVSTSVSSSWLRGIATNNSGVVSAIGYNNGTSLPIYSKLQISGTAGSTSVSLPMWPQ